MVCKWLARAAKMLPPPVARMQRLKLARRQLGGRAPNLSRSCTLAACYSMQNAIADHQSCYSGCFPARFKSKRVSTLRERR